MAGLVLFALHYLVGGFIVIGADNAEWISDARPGWSILAFWFVPYVLAHVAFWIEFASKDGKWLRG